MVVSKQRALRRQSGFSLLEVLLTVGVAATFLIFVIGIGKNIAERQANRAAANYVVQIVNAIDDRLQDPDRFRQLHTAVGGLTVRQASVDDLIQGTGLFTGLGRNPILGDNFSLIAPLRQTYRIVLRVADNFADTTDSEALEVFVLSENLISDDQATDIAGLLGGNGGALRDAGVTATTALDIRSVYGSWEVPMANLIGTAWYTAVTGAAPPTLQNGSYVVSYNYLDINRVARDYLYRVDKGDVELNTMHADLSLGNYNLIGADDVSTSGDLTTGQIIVSNQRDAGGNIIPSTGDARLQGVTRIIGTLQADGPMTAGAISADGAARVSIVDGTLNASTISPERADIQTLNPTTLITSSDLTVQDVSLGDSSSGTLTGGTLDINSPSGLFAVTNGLSTEDMDVGNQLRTSRLNSQNVTVSSGNTATISLETTGAYTQTGGGVSVDRLNVSGTARAGGAPGWTCGSGC